MYSYEQPPSTNRPLNRDLLETKGYRTALIYSTVIHEYAHQFQKQQTRSNGWFICSLDALEQELPYSKPMIKRELNRLTASGRLEEKRFQGSMHKHYRIAAS